MYARGGDGRVAGGGGDGDGDGTRRESTTATDDADEGRSRDARCDWRRGRSSRGEEARFAHRGEAGERRGVGGRGRRYGVGVRGQGGDGCARRADSRGADARERARSRTTRRRRRVGILFIDRRVRRCEERAPRIGSGEMFFEAETRRRGIHDARGSRETRTGPRGVRVRSIEGTDWRGTGQKIRRRRCRRRTRPGRSVANRTEHTGLVARTGDASHCSVAQDLDDDVVGPPGAYKRGRAHAWLPHAVSPDVSNGNRRDARTRRRRVHAHVRRG